MLSSAYIVEIFPFTVRSKGLAMYTWWARAAYFTSTFINPIGMDDLKWKFYIFYCAWISFEVVCIYFLFPETSGRTLEELSFLLEGQEASRKVQKRIEHLLGPSPTSGTEKERNVQVEHA